MDIHESFRRILEQKKSVTQLFFTVALGSCPEVRLVLWGKDCPGPLLELSGSAQLLSAPLAIYAQFASDLLQALREFHGTDWTPELMAQWQRAIEHVGRAIFASCQGPTQD